MKNSEPQKITPDQMREAINRSGYLIEQRSKTALEEHGYYVETNRSYADPETDKSREYDVFAIKFTPLFRSDPGGLASVVICECMNNAQPVVFFGDDRPITLMFHERVKASGIPVVVWDHGSYVSLSHFYRFETLYHQCRERVAKQYCSFARSKEGVWLAKHPDEQHQTFTALVAGADAAACEHYRNLEPPAPGEGRATNLQIYYPLLVLQGDLYTAHQTGDGPKLLEDKHVQYLHQYCVKGKPETYQIDIIQESYLRAYLELVDSEIQSFRKRLAQRREVLTVSINQLVAEYRANRSKRVPWQQILRGGAP